jgi:Domain of unknown function (DUF6265)
MKTPSIAAALLLVLAIGRAEPADTIASRVGWLAGCWSGEKGTTRFTEVWVPALPDLMVGVSVTTKPGKPAQFEFLRVEARDGSPAYVAQPQGAPPTAFALSAADSTDDTATFVNMQHDFPKRVSYRRVDAASLLAWIDAGPRGSMRVEFPMKRTACPAGPAS